MTIIKKKQIIALSLVVMIVVAGYLQYSYNNSGYSKSDDEAGKLGEAVYVDNQDFAKNSEEEASTEIVNNGKTVSKEILASKEAEDYFAQTKLEKEISRSKETDELGSIAAEESASQEIKDMAYKKMVAIIDCSDKEMRIEALIKKQGFDDVIAFFAEDGSVDIIVKASNLSSAQVTQIADIVTRHASVELDKISVKQKF